MTLEEDIVSHEEIYEKASAIFEKGFDVEKGIRLLGVTLTTLSPMYYERITLPLWKSEGE